MNDEVRVVIDGKELTGWEACSIDMAVDHIADGISLDGPWDWARKDLRQVVRPFGYQRTEVYIDDDLYLTGRLDKVGPKLSAGDRVINVQGRSLTGQLADCSHKGNSDGSGWEFSNLALSTICRRVCKPFGISVRADNDTAPIPEARCNYGQGAADFLNAVAGPRNILLNASYKGELVLTWGASLVNKTPGARLVEGEYPVEAVDAEYDSTKRFSIYQVATQFAGLPDIIDTARDASVTLYRPRLSVDSDAQASPEDQEALTALENEVKTAKGQTASQAKSMALKSRSASRLRVACLSEAVSVNVAVTGWRRPDGKRWAERQTVTLLAPSAMIYKEVPWLIAGVVLKLDVSGGRSTTLRLVLPETYSGTLPKETPWA